MWMLNRIAIAGAVGLLLTALPVLAKTLPKVKPKAVLVETAVIENTGSTNMLGYQIRVSSDGSVAKMFTTALRVTTVMTQPISFQDAGKLFRDLNVAMPLSSLPVGHGMRSASFGTQTFITYKGQKSPDLTFASDPRTAALKADIAAIAKTLGVGNAPKRPIIVQQSTRPLSEQHFLERY